MKKRNLLPQPAFSSYIFGAGWLQEAHKFRCERLWLQTILAACSVLHTKIKPVARRKLDKVCRLETDSIGTNELNAEFTRAT
jgi:hypothetical protein